jgi:3-oxoacyl-[acyl-carrier protein] reductase
MSDLKGKIALVTGGSRGIGAAIVKSFVKNGAQVAFTYVSAGSAEKAQALVTEIEQGGGKALAIQADSGVIADVKDAIEKTAAHFGGLDILVNNAALWIMGPIENAEEMADQYAQQMDVNVRSIPTAVRAASKLMKDGGRIIIIGSVAGAFNGTANLTEYGATKAAAAAFGRGYAWDLGGRNITVNTIQPGPIDTDMNPANGEWADAMKAKTALGRYGNADEIAAVASFLAGPEASYVTGAVINVDGGYLA